jgi:hypothetical protein
MTLTRLRDEIEAHVIVKEVLIEEEYIPHIASLTYDSNYVQIIYDYGIDILHILLEILESYEIYEQCAVIKQVIENTNELEGKSFSTTYKKNE